MTQNKIRSLGVLLILPLLTVFLGAAFSDLPSANALQTRNMFDDSHSTARFGSSPVCGDHICTPGEHSKMMQAMEHAQMGKETKTAMTQPGQSMPQAMPMESKDLGSVLKLSNANLPLVIPLVQGLYDGKDVFYITTEASDSNAASELTKFTNFPVTFAPALAKTPPTASANIYLFKNGIKGPGIMGFQPQVVDSIPGDAKYSPLWRVNVVEWKDPASATTLGSEDEVLTAESIGQVTVTFTHIVVNCPIVQWSGNKEGTIPAGHMKIRDGITESGAYGSAQVLNIDTQNMKITFVAHRGFGPDGSTIYYIATDASQKGPADMLGVVFANTTQGTISTSSSADLFQFSNGIAGSGPLGFQSGVGSSKAGDEFYSPMWRIQVVTWKDSSMATVLENSHDLTSKTDLITTAPAGFIVNCPFFSVETVYAHVK
ncbi:MAG: hypothetical protein E6K83_04870 [Thaumarchaeota archaeon]|nr:MAG: hypothetical protein E6K83_04870 [Nitrososphaerota archaeon]